MTDHPPTITHAELLDLSDALYKVSDVIATSPDYCEPTALGLLAEADDDAIRSAAKILLRLSRDAKYTRIATTSYLPVQTLAPVQS